MCFVLQLDLVIEKFIYNSIPILTYLPFVFGFIHATKTTVSNLMWWTKINKEDIVVQVI